MKHLRLRLFSFLSILILGLVSQSAHAAPLTFSGTFEADNDSFDYLFFTGNTAQNFTFATTSYANGGFVPVLTLFGQDGNVVGFDGADGMCRGSAASGGSGICDDAFLQETLAPNKLFYLALTEFPNVAIGTLADGFLFASNPHITGDLCGVAGGTFLQTDTASCNQRTGDFNLSVDASAVTPEPPTGLLVLAPALLLFAYARRQLV